MILNEVKYAEKIIKNGIVGNKPSSTLMLLARYYSQIENHTEKQVYKDLMYFMSDYYKGFEPALWEERIEYFSKHTKKPLRQIDNIKITQNEINKIENLDIKYQKLMFTMLCYAKLYDAVSQDNNGWTNQTYKEMFKLSRTHVKYAKDKFLMINDLVNLGMISLNKKNDRHNFRVLFIDDNDEAAMIIDDFRELGYEWLKYQSENKFIRCTKCGILTLRNSNRHKYCSKCAEEENRKRTKYNMRAIRNV